MNCFLFLRAILALLNPDCESGPGARDPIESGSTTLGTTMEKNQQDSVFFTLSKLPRYLNYNHRWHTTVYKEKYWHLLDILSPVHKTCIEAKKSRVADPHQFNADQDPDLAFHFNADPDPDPTLHQSDGNLRPLV